MLREVVVLLLPVRADKCCPAGEILSTGSLAADRAGLLTERRVAIFKPGRFDSGVTSRADDRVFINLLVELNSSL